jgi:hypothetical protein
MFCSGQWPEADAASDLAVPFKDARSFMSEMPVEREVRYVAVLVPFLSSCCVFCSAAKLAFRKVTAGATAMPKHCVLDSDV